MRIRNNRKVKQDILNSPLYVPNPEDYKGKWKTDYFLKNNPVYVEFGSGRGKFIFESSLNNKDINYIGVEKYTKIIARAAKRFQSYDEINNVALINDDILNSIDYLNKDEVDRIYLNFLDPWPKTRHIKRRCTSHRFLNIYKKILKQKGEIHLKTDDENLFEYSLSMLENRDFEIVFTTWDLHSTSLIEENVETEYEKKFSKKGKKIKKLIAIKI